MRQSLPAQVNKVINTLILLTAVLTPLIFTPFTSEYFETAKFVLLISVVLLSLLLWSFNWVLEGRITFTKTPFDLPLLALLLVVLLSTLFSETKYVAIFGNFPRIQGSATAWISYILFFFVAVSHIKTPRQVRTLLYGLFLSATIVAVVTLLSFFGIYLPLPFARFINFTPTGSSFSTAALLMLLLPALFINISNSKEIISSISGAALATLYIVVILLTGGNSDSGLGQLFSPVFLALYATLALTFLAIRPRQTDRNLVFLIAPIIVSFIIFGLSFIPLPQGNPLMTQRLNFPREVQLPLSTSWQISGQSFVKYPFLGSGPSSYLFNFTRFKSPEFNFSSYWNAKFDSAFNEYLNVLGTLGILGLLSFLVLSAQIVNFGWLGLAEKHDNLTKILSLSVLASIILLLMHPATPVLMVATILILAMLTSTHKSINSRVEDLAVGIKTSRLTDSPAMRGLVSGDILPVVVFIPVVVGTLIIFKQLKDFSLADYYHRQALNSAATRGVDTYNALVSAERLNNYIDLYRTDLALTNFALANSLVAAKGPSESSPAGSLTDNDKQTIQRLLSQAITEGRVATELSPRSSTNWEILASIYRQISGVAQNSLDFALDAYGRAIQRDPNNPSLRLQVGGVYYSVKDYNLAVRFFSDAVNLKPDYANAYYNLAIALRDNGDLNGAVAAAQRVVALLQSDTKSKDYKTASELLSDLQNKAATQSAQQTPPAARESSALQKSNLPNVLDLGQKPQPATPEAVKVSPRPSPTP